MGSISLLPRLGMLAAFSTAFLTSGQSFGQSPADVSRAAKNSIVHIAYDYVDSKTDSQKSESGSGFVVTKNGYVLTAYHVVRAWLGQTPEQRATHPIRARLGSNKSVPIFDLIYVEGNDDRDVVLLKLSDPTKEYARTPVCFGTTPASGDRLYGFGFPNNRDFTPSEGTFSNDSSPDGRWEAGISFSYGMSGGPVYNQAGHVIGLVKGGLDLSNTTNLITPVVWAKTILDSRAPSFAEECAQHTTAASPISITFTLTFNIKLNTPRIGVSTGSLVQEKCENFSFGAPAGWAISPGSAGIVSQERSGSTSRQIITQNAQTVEAKLCALSTMNGLNKRTGDMFARIEYQTQRSETTTLVRGGSNLEIAAPSGVLIQERWASITTSDGKTFDFRASGKQGPFDVQFLGDRIVVSIN